MESQMPLIPDLGGTGEEMGELGYRDTEDKAERGQNLVVHDLEHPFSTSWNPASPGLGGRWIYSSLQVLLKQYPANL